MNLRLLLCIALGLFTTYIGVVMLLQQLRPQARSPLPPKPNFSARSATFVDPETGEKTIHREITVSTKLAPTAGPPTPQEPQPAKP